MILMHESDARDICAICTNRQRLFLCAITKVSFVIVQSAQSFMQNFGLTFYLLRVLALFTALAVMSARKCSDGACFTPYDIVMSVNIIVVSVCAKCTKMSRFTGEFL